MNFEFNLSVFLSAGAGAGLVQLLVQLFLSHWLQKRFYKFTLDQADRRECAKEVLQLLNPENTKRWNNFSDDIYSKAYMVSDRLLTLKENRFSERLDEFVSAERSTNDLLDKVLRDPGTPAKNDYTQDFLNSQHTLDELKKELVKIAQKLKGN